MKQISFVVAAAGLFSFLFFWGCAHQEASVKLPASAQPAATGAASSWTLYYTANRTGEVDPCGCQVHQLGGIHRLSNYFAGNRTQESLFMDSGDTFYSSPTLNPARKSQEHLKAQLLAGAFKTMGLDAFTPGERDFAEGLETLKELQKLSGAVFVAANLYDGKHEPVFERFHIFERAGEKVGVIGLVDAEGLAKVEGVVVEKPEANLEKLIAEMKAKGAERIVVLSHLGLAHDREIAALAKGSIDFILGAHSFDPLREPERVAGTLIVQPLDQGQQIGNFVVKVGSPSGEAIHTMVDLDTNYDAPNALSRLVAQYKEGVRELAVKDAKPVAPTTAKHPYVAHASSCRTCHQKQYDFWATTKHASAYLVLFAKNEHFNPECIGCHSLGFEQPGGFQKIAKPIATDLKVKKGEPFVEKLMKEVFAKDPGKGPLDSRVEPERYQKLHAQYQDVIKKYEDEGKIQKLFIGVQCEHCHGNRNGHPSPEVPTLKKVQESSCRGCHAPPNAPTFDPKSISKVACPLSSKL